MEMKPVTSSNIKAIGYENGLLVVHFSNGSRYSYKGVPARVHGELMAAESVGKHFMEHIRNGQYTHERLADEGSQVRYLEPKTKNHPPPR